MLCSRKNLLDYTVLNPCCVHDKTSLITQFWINVVFTTKPPWLHSFESMFCSRQNLLDYTVLNKCCVHDKTSWLHGFETMLCSRQNLLITRFWIMLCSRQNLLITQFWMHVVFTTKPRDYTVLNPCCVHDKTSWLHGFESMFCSRQNLLAYTVLNPCCVHDKTSWLHGF